MLDLWSRNSDKKDLFCSYLDSLVKRSKDPCSNCKQEICQHGKVILTDEPLPVGLEVRIAGSGDKGLVGKIEKSTEYEDEGEKWIRSKVRFAHRKEVRTFPSFNVSNCDETGVKVTFHYLQYNCKATNFRSNIPRIISSTGCSNCRMETCLKGEEVEDACLFVGTKVFITGTKKKGVVTKVFAKYGAYFATINNAYSDQRYVFLKAFSPFSYDC